MNSITPMADKETESKLTAGEVLCVYTAVQHLKDSRGRRGRRYSLALILTYLLLAKAAGETTLQAITEWIRLRAAWLQQVLPEAGPTFPCAATYSHVLRAVEPEQLNQVLMALLTRVRAESREQGEQRHVVLDGKTLRGTQKHLAADQAKMHQVSLYETGTGVVLKEQVVGDKESEQSRVEEFLTPLYVKGRLLSADALHTHASVCASITASGGDYLLFAKGNQPTLRQDLQLFFREPPADCRDWRTARVPSKGHGRLEQRELIASTELNDFLATSWPGVAQVFVLRRRVSKSLVCTQEYVYGLTSLTPAQAGPEELLRLIRGQWTIENRLHWRRDVTLREDACQVRKGSAPRVLAILNSFLLALFDFLGVTNVAAQMRLFAARPWLALRLFIGSLANIK